MPKRKLEESFNFFNQVYLPLPNVLIDLVISYSDMLLCLKCKKLYPFNLQCLHCLPSNIYKITIRTQSGYEQLPDLTFKFTNLLDDNMFQYILNIIYHKYTFHKSSWTNSNKLSQKLILKVSRKPNTRKERYPVWWNLRLLATFDDD